MGMDNKIKIQRKKGVKKCLKIRQNKSHRERQKGGTS